MNIIFQKVTLKLRALSNVLLIDDGRGYGSVFIFLVAVIEYGNEDYVCNAQKRCFIITHMDSIVKTKGKIVLVFYFCSSQ